jgi:uncharacterized membrane protein
VAGVDALTTAVLVAATLAMGLAAGLFASYSYSVMPGLARGDDRTYVTAMRNINVAIINGWFALTFGGAFVLTALAAVLHLRAEYRPAFGWIAAGLAGYIAVLAVTFAVNVPLNNALDRAGATAEDPAEVRRRFEGRWVRWNAARSVLSLAAFCCLIWAVVLHGRLTS